MESNLSLDWKYYFGTLVIMALGIWGIYLGSRIYNQDKIVSAGVLLVLLSIFAFLAKNAYYMFESSEPDNHVNIGVKPAK